MSSPSVHACEPRSIGGGAAAVGGGDGAGGGAGGGGASAWADEVLAVAVAVAPLPLFPPQNASAIPTNATRLSAPPATIHERGSDAKRSGIESASAFNMGAGPAECGRFELGEGAADRCPEGGGGGHCWNWGSGGGCDTTGAAGRGCVGTTSGLS